MDKGTKRVIRLSVEPVSGFEEPLKETQPCTADFPGDLDTYDAGEDFVDANGHTVVVYYRCDPSGNDPLGNGGYTDDTIEVVDDR